MFAPDSIFGRIDARTEALVRSFSMPVIELSSLAESVMRRFPTVEGLRTFMSLSEEIANNVADMIPQRLSESVSNLGSKVWVALDQMPPKKPVDSQGLMDITQEQLLTHMDAVRTYFARKFRNALLMEDASARYEVGDTSNLSVPTMGGFKMPSTDFLKLTSRKFMVDWVSQARVATLQAFGREQAQVISEDVKSSNDGMIFNIVANLNNSQPNFTDIVDTVFHPRSYALVGDYHVSP